MNGITGNPIEINDLFNNRYTVQFYQREYNWGTKQIEELIYDLSNEFMNYHKEGDTQDEVEQYGNYFLGPIILTDKNEIIDGQQRLSSLTLLLIYLNNLQKNIKSNLVNIDNLIFTKKFGKKTFCIDVKERTECLEGLYENETYNIENEKNESVINLYNRYKDIEKIFPQELKSEILPLFIEWLIYKVTLIKITTTTEQDAHTVFVTMNDRGLRLTPSEMLKGYLLSEINNNENRNRANKLWQETILELKELEKDGEADFIKHWIRSQYAQSIREGKKGAEDKDYEIIGQAFHKWIRENRLNIGLVNSSAFENFILKEFKLFSNIYKKLKKYSKEFNEDFEYVFYNSDRDFNLQYQIILASICPDDSIDIIDKKINLVSCFIDQYISRRVFNFKTVNYSSVRYTMFNITKDIRRKSVGELKDILKEKLDNLEYDLDVIDDFYLNQFTGRYMLHILARITYYLDKNCGISSSFYNYINRSQKNSYDIEHIWANNYNQSTHKVEFGTEEEFKHFRNKFGGLLILPKDKNRSLQDMEYKDKVKKYDSENLLARSLNKNCYINNPSFIRFINDKKLGFKYCNKFNKNEFIERNNLYKDLCKQIWDVNILDAIYYK
ncbi:DUF262 domain-containing protein [Paraclostridium sordellii]|uniref:DUF262 domain-containing protein n=1 Tax=Paraclostridium sordellii TaxID=1505 RepID=UPI0005E66A64|nr:DUF262 domain-containing protein [Paeniclostridium sordellii]CEN87082.1 Protein of uncharacterised function DUF262 [[Clostridium] sordellii] [Paeniclostridium sordellii]